MRTVVVAILLLGLTVPALPRDKSKSGEYKGKIYKEIRVDDKGIFLVDTLGNEIEVPIGGAGEGESEIPELVVPTIPRIGHPDIEPGFYTDTIDVISKVGGTAVVAENEYVIGSVAVVGNAVIRGRVGGAVTATGKVRISPSGIVEGNVTGSKVIQEPGSQVMGRVSEQQMGIPFPEVPWGEQRESHAGPAAVAGLIWLMVQLAIAVGIAMLFQRPTDRLKETYHDNIFKALVVGFLAEIAFLPAFVILIITIIGIPVALIALPLGVVAAGFLGFSAFCLFISDFVKAKQGEFEESRLMKTVIGFMILQVPAIGFFLGLVIDSQAMSILFGIVSGILFFIVLTASLGATILTRFGTRDYDREKQHVKLDVKVQTSA